MMNWGSPKRLFVYEWKGPQAFESFAALADQPYSLFFDSARPEHPNNRYSFLCWHPFETIEAKDGTVHITNAENSFTYSADPFKIVRDRLALWGEDRKRNPHLPPFQGGVAGFFGYDLGRQIEKMPSLAKTDSSMPDMAIGLYDKVIAYDHAKGTANLLIHASDEAAALVQKSYIEKIVQEKAYIPALEKSSLNWTTRKTNSQYCADIEKTIDYIYAGDIFQANISRRFQSRLPQNFDSYAHYCHLRKINAAPFSTFMNFGDLKLASASPERFLSVTNRSVETRPIKGTLPVTQPATDLLNSEKDRAENAMIVDLLRNDLSKVCEDHSIDVTDLFGIETFEGLHHMVSTIKGTLRADQTPIDLLRACFPGGSITGAPKIRAMQIIEEIEPDRRGPYCGAMGYVGFDGTMDTNIAIRTLVYNKDTVSLQTGGGITAESVPAKELDETLVKAQKLFESFREQTNIARKSA